MSNSRTQLRRRSARRPCASGLVLSALLLGATSSFGAAKTWDGGGADTNWLTGANWDANTAPVAGDSLTFAGTVGTASVNNFPYTFNGTSTTQLSSPIFAGVTFAADAGPFEITGSFFGSSGNITNSSANPQVVQAPMYFSASRTINVGTAGVTFHRIFSNAARTITKTGAGTLRLTRALSPGVAIGSNDFINLTVSAGTVVLAGAWGDTMVNNLTVNAGGRVEYDPAYITAPAASWAGQVNAAVSLLRGSVLDLKGSAGTDEAGYFMNNRFQTLSGESTDGVTAAALITNSAVGNPASLSIRRRSTGVQTFAGTIEGEIGLDFSYGGANPGQINVLSGTNTYTGHTQIGSETLVINGNQSAASGALLVESVASARLGGTGTIGASTATIGSQLAPGPVTASGDAGEAVGTLTFLGDVSFVTGTTNWLGVGASAVNNNVRLNVNLNKWVGAVAGTDHDAVVARSLALSTNSAVKLRIHVIGGAALGFDDTPRSFTLVTTTNGVSGLAADNWSVTTSGIVATGTWSLATANSDRDLVLSYTPATVVSGKVWDGGGADDKVSTAANWFDNVAPVAPEALAFDGSVRLSPTIDTNANTQVVVTGDLTEASTSVTVSDATGLAVGQGVAGTGISVGTTVTGISGTTVTLSLPATASGAGVSLTFTSFVYTQINGITFNAGAGAFTLGGNGLRLGDSSAAGYRITNDSTSLQTVSAPIAIENSLNEVWTRTGNIALTGSVSSTVARTLSFVGNNTTTLGGATDNSFLVVSPSAGTVVLDKASSASVHAAYRLSMGSAVTGTVRLAGTGGDQIFDTQALVLDSGVLDLNGRSEAVGSLSGAVPAIVGMGVITNNATGTTSTLTVNQTASASFNGTLKDGAGVLAVSVGGGATNELQITGVNTFSGGTTITGAGIRINAASAQLGTGPITLADAQNTAETLPLSAYSWPNGGRTLYIANFNYTLANPLVVAPDTNNTIEFSNNGTLVLAGPLSGSGLLRFTNGFSPRVVLAGDTSAFTGQIDVGSTNQTNTVSLRGTTGGLPLARVRLNPVATGAAVLSYQPETAVSATIPLGELSTDSANYITSAAVPATLRNDTAGSTATWRIGGLGTSSQFEGVVTDGTGVSAIEKVGAGVLTLSGTISYTGSTTVAAGTLALAQAGLGDTSIVSIASGATLALNHAATDTIGVLYVGGSALASGVWGAVGSGAPNQSSSIIGTGLLAVTYGPAEAAVLSATAGDAVVDLSWTAAAGTTTYTVLRSLSPGGAATVLASAVSVTTYSDTTVTNGTTYYYSVVSNQTTLTSNVVSATPAAPITSQYALWSASVGLTPGLNDGSAADPDGDLVSNVLEFVYGSLPLVAGAKLPVVTVAGGQLSLIFQRSDESEAEVTVAAEYGNDLVGWTSVPVGPSSTTADLNGVVVTVSENGALADTVTVTVPMTLAPQGRLFARVKATTLLP